MAQTVDGIQPPPRHSHTERLARVDTEMRQATRAFQHVNVPQTVQVRLLKVQAGDAREPPVQAGKERRESVAGHVAKGNGGNIRRPRPGGDTQRGQTEAEEGAESD